jgi:hypothetical protein
LTLSDKQMYIPDIEDRMSDGPYKSLPMRRHWRALAERAATPAYTPDQVAESFPIALKNEFREAPLAQIRNILGGPQDSLFQEDPVIQLEAVRRSYRGSAVANTLIDCTLEAYAEGLTGDTAVKAALENALDEYARAGCLQIEEHYRREEPQSTMNVRDRLKVARIQCPHSEIASELMSGDAGARGKARLQKRTGLDEGPSL